jgi:ATP-binding protein involved in chromosome partitioning
MSSHPGSRAVLAEQVWAAAAAVRDPEIGLPLGDLGMLRGVELHGDTAKVRVALTVPGCPMKERIARDIAAAATAVPGVDRVEIEYDAMGDAERGAVAARLRGPGDRERFFADGRTTVIAVASGKGGVGKSTVTVNLACAFAAAGKRVGLIDADVWGFSVPRMLGISQAPVGFGGMLFPAQAHGVKVVSAGLFADERTPIVWRGPMLHAAMRQFLADVHWGELDVLLCDLPPGTGDVPISLAAMLPTASFVIVTSPQEAARTVAERAGRMAAQAGLRVCGVIENMGSFVCPCCGEETPIFGDGGGQAVASALGAPLLARVPVTQALREAGDSGMPLVVADPHAAASVAFEKAAKRLGVLARPRRRLPVLAAQKPVRASVAVGAQVQGRSVR